MSRLHKFREFLEEKEYSKSTIESKLKDVEAFKRWLDKAEKTAQRLTYTEALKYVSVLKKRGLQPQTINFYLASIRTYYAFLKTKRNPFQTIEIRGTRQKLLTNTLTPEQLLTVYQSYTVTTPIQYRNKVLIGLYCFQGINRTELHEIKLTDLELNKGQITIPRTTRSNKRTLPLNPVQLLDLVDYLAVRETIAKKETDKLLVFEGVNLANAQAVITRKLHKQNPYFVDFRQVRNSLIMNWLKENNLRKAQYNAGHRYISSTEAYLVNDITRLKENVLKFHPLNG